MPLTWPKPFPLVFFAAVPLFLMWAPARALLGAAVAKLPASKPRLLSSSQSLRRRRGGDGIPAAKGLSCSSSSSSGGGGEGTGDGVGKVIVIAGAHKSNMSCVCSTLHDSTHPRCLMLVRQLYVHEYRRCSSVWVCWWANCSKWIPFFNSTG